MAKNKRKKRGWSGAPASRTSGTRTGGAGAAASTRTAAAGAAPDTEDAPAGAATSDGTAGSGSSAVRTAASRPRATVESESRPRPAAARPGPGAAVSNRVARKEEARRQREALRRKAQRRRRLRRGAIVAAAALGVAGIVTLIVTSGGGGGRKQVDPAKLEGINSGPAPWGPEIDHLPDRLRQMGLPPLGGEALAYHIHQNLVVYINGAREVVPFGLGYISSTSLAEIHTHSSSGTIHVEAGADRHFTLGDVFDIWGVLFTKDQIGGYHVNAQDKIRVFVNGNLVHGDPTKVPLRDQEVIVLTYGTAAQVPSPMPTGFVYEGEPTAAGSSTTPAPSASAT